MFRINVLLDCAHRPRVQKTLKFFLEFMSMDTVQKHIYYNYHTPSLETYRIYIRMCSTTLHRTTPPLPHTHTKKYTHACAYRCFKKGFTNLKAYINSFGCRSQWPRGLRQELSSPAPTLRSWVRIPLRHGCLYVFCVRLFCVYIVSGETPSRPNKRLMRTYHWISLFMLFIKLAN
jgi:hypothetical protein